MSNVRFVSLPYLFCLNSMLTLFGLWTSIHIRYTYRKLITFYLYTKWALPSSSSSSSSSLQAKSSVGFLKSLNKNCRSSKQFDLLNLFKVHQYLVHHYCCYMSLLFFRFCLLHPFVHLKKKTNSLIFNELSINKTLI